MLVGYPWSFGFERASEYVGFGFNLTARLGNLGCARCLRVSPLVRLAAVSLTSHSFKSKTEY